MRGLKIYRKLLLVAIISFVAGLSLFHGSPLPVPTDYQTIGHTAVARIAPKLSQPQTSVLAASNEGLTLEMTPETPSFHDLVIEQNTPPPAPDCQQVACMALTFDDGPDSVVTRQIMFTLLQNKVPATFFVLGHKVGGQAELLKQLVAGGNEIGNHSWDHPNMAKLSPEQIEQQIGQTQTAVTNLGVAPPRFFRPPYELYNDKVLARLTMPMALWNVDPRDWVATDSKALADQVVSQARPGAVVLLHDTKPTTAAALDGIVKALKPNYHLVTVSQLLSLPPDARGIHYGR